MKSPPNEYRRYLRFLYHLQVFGIKLGLENIRSLLNFLGNPHLKYPVIHIAGTNGKGSTASMIASILTASGYTTGLYTSPHLVNFTERIRIDGTSIAEDQVVAYTKILKREVEKCRATFFETTTAMAFMYFADQKVDVAVIETGLGGRFDATNIVNPVLSIITSIGMDHMEHLGNSISEIAFEKGGIVKPGIPCIVGFNENPALDVVRRICRKNQSRILSVHSDTKSEVMRSSIEGSIVNISTRRVDIQNLHLSLAGNYQINNACMAILAVENLALNGSFPDICKKSIKSGLGAIKKYSHLCGRLDILCKNPLILCDVAHNPPAIERLCAALSDLNLRDLILIFGVMKDKDVVGIVDSLIGFSRMVIVVKPDTVRAMEEGSIVEIFHAKHFKAITGGSVKRGVELAVQKTRLNDTILVLGSHYVVGEAINISLN
ncbi:MAG: bifunctional folylpolyglutamate synthase/dihydrofolate synthase [Bacteroidota bacterium]